MTDLCTVQYYFMLVFLWCVVCVCVYLYIYYFLSYNLQLDSARTYSYCHCVMEDLHCCWPVHLLFTHAESKTSSVFSKDKNCKIQDKYRLSRKNENMSFSL
jgi:hypothetical protein